jgi:hypothetical protein
MVGGWTVTTVLNQIDEVVERIIGVVRSGDAADILHAKTGRVRYRALPPCRRRLRCVIHVARERRRIRKP